MSRLNKWSIEYSIQHLLEALEQPDEPGGVNGIELRSGIVETPKRVAKAWVEAWAAGYEVDVPALFKTFDEQPEHSVDEMISVCNIPFYSMCEHHMAPIFGRVTVAYIPDPQTNRIVGLSKMSRVVQAYARRLQVQERMTVQIADAIDTNLRATGVGVRVAARHMCMESRGICQQGHYTVTTALRGNFKEGTVRSEFLSLCTDLADKL